jgi:hypothetical protein
MEIYAVHISALLALWSVARLYDCPKTTASADSPALAEPEGCYDWR